VAHPQIQISADCWPGEKPAPPNGCGAEMVFLFPFVLLRASLHTVNSFHSVQYTFMLAERVSGLVLWLGCAEPRPEFVTENSTVCSNSGRPAFMQL
jgi:hypothetical protein